MSVTVTTTAFVQEHATSWQDYVQAVSAVSMVFLTVFIILYAKSTARYNELTVREGQYDRRKDSVEKMLKDSYNPLLSILGMAKSRCQAYASHYQLQNGYLFTFAEVYQVTDILRKAYYSDMKGFTELVTLMTDNNKIIPDHHMWIADDVLKKHHEDLTDASTRLNGELIKLSASPGADVGKVYKDYQNMIKSLDASQKVMKLLEELEKFTLPKSLSAPPENNTSQDKA